jgi:hypothetical protein
MLDTGFELELGCHRAPVCCCCCCACLSAAVADAAAAAVTSSYTSMQQFKRHGVAQVIGNRKKP